jgi:flagellar protein FliS
MAHYATTLGRNPEATYRQIDIAGRTGGADPHELVALLYDELGRALRAVAAAIDSGNRAVRSEKATRAISILFALEAGLDFERGGDLSKTLAGLYRGARAKVIDASLGDDPRPFIAVATNMAQIAQAWAEVRRG